MADKDFITGSHNPINFFKSMIFDIAFMRNNPGFFEPDGLWAFCGSQGSGKTLSAVQTVEHLKKTYPKARVVSNLHLANVDYEPFEDYDQIATTQNGIYGVIFLIDEAQVLWNCIESRGIPVSEIGTLCQNRKDRRVVIFTSQVYGRVAKPIREQYKYVILCNKVLKYIQWNTVVDPCSGGYTSEEDGHMEGEIIKRSIWFHSPKAYQAYDTYNKIIKLDRKKVLKNVR